ncbi:MAG: hemin uptake protein HemP [Planctomycetota bacterium]
MNEQANSDRQPPTQPATRIIDSRELLANENTVLIRHENDFYRLLKTKNGKLILQK